TVRMLEKRSAGQLPQRWEPRAERFRPIGNGKRGVVRGHQRPKYQQQNRPRNDEDRKTVHTLVVRCIHGGQPNGKLYLSYYGFAWGVACSLQASLFGSHARTVQDEIAQSPDK